MRRIILLLTLSVFFITSCNETNPSDIKGISTSIDFSARWISSNELYTYVGGINTVTAESNLDGSQIVIRWPGDQTGMFEISSGSTAIGITYLTLAGTQNIAIDGLIHITSIDTEKITGTFYCTMSGTASPGNFIEFREGIINLSLAETL